MLMTAVLADQMEHAMYYQVLDLPFGPVPVAARVMCGRFHGNHDVAEIARAGIAGK